VIFVFPFCRHCCCLRFTLIHLILNSFIPTLGLKTVISSTATSKRGSDSLFVLSVSLPFLPVEKRKCEGKKSMTYIYMCIGLRKDVGREGGRGGGVLITIKIKNRCVNSGNTLLLLPLSLRFFSFLLFQEEQKTE